jgi:HNH endonuclease/NUMOD3 motif
MPWPKGRKRSEETRRKMSETQQRRSRIDPLTRLLRSTEKHDGSDGCWVWTGAKNQNGYGNFFLDGQIMKAHRASYQLHLGCIPEGLQVLHRCDNPSCIRPDHLFLGTPDDNMKDASSKGRLKGSTGYRHSKQVREKISNALAGKPKSEKAKAAYKASKREASPLSSAHVSQLKELREKGWSFRALAGKFGVSATTAFNICKGRTWN